MNRLSPRARTLLASLALVVAAAGLGFGGNLAYAAFSGDGCCVPGSPCCFPGSPCCHGGGVVARADAP